MPNLGKDKNSCDRNQQGRRGYREKKSQRQGLGEKRLNRPPEETSVDGRPGNWTVTATTSGCQRNHSKVDNGTERRQAIVRRHHHATNDESLVFLDLVKAVE